jgi:hypothetical protein
MALPAARRLTVELVPHCTSVVRDGWVGSHDVRPLAEAGMRQAEALVAAIGADVDGIYSSPTARCRQTVGPLAAAVGLPVHDLAELYEAGDFGEPAAGVDQIPDLMVRALGGGWAAGRMLRAVAIMMDAHPGAGSSPPRTAMWSRCCWRRWGAPLACPGRVTSAAAAGTRCGSPPATSPSPRTTQSAR